MAIILELDTATATFSAGSIIKRAYRILGDLGTGESLTSAQAEEGLEALNAMLDSLSIERLMVFVVKQQDLTWPINTTSRTIGLEADFDTVRPNRVEEGTYFEDAGNVAYPVSVIRNREVYDAIYDKTVQSSYPELIFYETTNSALGTLYVYPVPNQALTLKLNSWQVLTEFNNVNSAFAFPPGYRRMLAYNLAKELEAESGLPLPPSAYRIASQSKANIKRHNNLPVVSSTESAYVLHGRGRSDIVAGK